MGASTTDYTCKTLVICVWFSMGTLMIVTVLVLKAKVMLLKSHRLAVTDGLP